MKLTGRHYHAMFFYDIKVGLNQEECLQLLQLSCENEAPSHYTEFGLLTQFR